MIMSIRRTIRIRIKNDDKSYKKNSKNKHHNDNSKKKNDNNRNNKDQNKTKINDNNNNNMNNKKKSPGPIRCLGPRTLQHSSAGKGVGAQG